MKENGQHDQYETTGLYIYKDFQKKIKNKDCNYDNRSKYNIQKKTIILFEVTPA